ncbi:thiamine biosynthesis protein ThiC [Kitasatospora sp. NPDC088346]
MKISQQIRAEHGEGSTAVDQAEAVVAGMKAESEECAAHGNRVHLPQAD